MRKEMTKGGWRVHLIALVLVPMLSSCFGTKNEEEGTATQQTTQQISENTHQVNEKRTYSNLSLFDSKNHKPINNAFITLKVDLNNDGVFENNEAKEFKYESGLSNFKDFPNYDRILRIESPGYISLIKRYGKNQPIPNILYLVPMEI